MQYLKEPMKYFTFAVHYWQYLVVERTRVILITQYREPMLWFPSIQWQELIAK